MWWILKNVQNLKFWVQSKKCLRYLYKHQVEYLHKYLHKILQDFKTRWLALLNKDHEFFQYNSGDLVYLISPLMSQLRTASRKILVKYVGPLALYKIIDPHNYLLMTLDGKLLQGLFELEELSQLSLGQVKVILLILHT